MPDKRKDVKMQRYLIENHGPNEANVSFMFRESLRICQRDGLSRITLCVPSKREFPTTIVGQMLGDAVKKLCQGQTVILPENVSLDLVCASKSQNFYGYDLIVAVYLSLDALYKFDTDMSAKAILFLPWMEEEGKQWLATRNPTILGANTWQVQQTTLPLEVVSTLSALSSGINLSTGLAHPKDRKTAREVLRGLRDSGHLLCPTDAKNWALKNGWSLDVANDLATEVASVFKSGLV